MRLDGRRESTNVDDRRRNGGGRGFGFKAGGLGIGGTIVVGLIVWLMGGDPTSVLQGSTGLTSDDYNYGQNYQPDEVDEELASFSRKILASTEDVWTQVFRQYGREYEAPQLVLFTGEVNSACGEATSQTGPFYCSADQSLYIDLSFFRDMRRQLGSDGDFAYAYVIAHEVGHHVQYLLGTLDEAHSVMHRQSQAEANRTSVRLELQADFLAGVWAYHENRLFRSLEDGDIEEAINTAAVIGDDYLQKKAYGRAQPETFNHGTSAQRMRWLKRGITTGDLSKGDTFSVPYSEL